MSDATEEIAKLQKMIIAYENDTSEETKAQIQQLKVNLQEAQEELQETEYDQFIADQKKLLDNLYTEYETILNRRIDDVDTLIIDSINAINTNAGDIKTTLETTASNLGISLSDKMSSIWTVDDEIKTVVSTYSSNFDTNAENVNGSLGTINSTIGTMNGVTTTISSTLSGIDTDIGTTNTTLSNINTAIGGLAGKLASEIAPLINTNNAGDASNPSDTSDGSSKPSGSAIPDKAPTTIYTDPNTKPTTKPETTKPSTTKPTTTTPKEKTGAEKLAEKIVKFGDASGSGMNAGKSGDNGIIKWNGNEYKVQNSGITYDSSTNLYKAAVEVLKFGDRQIFGYGGDIYGYLDGKIQRLEGRFWSSAGYDNFVNDVKGTYPAYAQGGLADFTGLAWMDGTKTKPEMVLDAEDTQNFIELKTVLAKMASNDISVGNSAYAGIQPMLYKSGFNVADRIDKATNYTVNTNVDNHFETHIEIDHVLDYNELCNKLRDDNKFEKMIQTMTLGKIMKKGSKYFYTWE